MSRPRRSSSPSAAFSLLEVIVALGVLAIGATAAFSLLIAGASAARRAEHEVDASLLAETMLNDLRADPSLNLDLTDLPTAQSVTDEDPRVPPPLNPETRYVVRDGTDPRWPDYRYDLAITPPRRPPPRRALVVPRRGRRPLAGARPAARLGALDRHGPRPHPHAEPAPDPAPHEVSVSAASVSPRRDRASIARRARPRDR